MVIFEVLQHLHENKWFRQPYDVSQSEPEDTPDDEGDQSKLIRFFTRGILLFVLDNPFQLQVLENSRYEQVQTTLQDIYLSNLCDAETRHRLLQHLLLYSNKRLTPPATMLSLCGAYTATLDMQGQRLGPIADDGHLLQSLMKAVRIQRKWQAVRLVRQLAGGEGEGERQLQAVVSKLRSFGPLDGAEKSYLLTILALAFPGCQVSEAHLDGLPENSTGSGGQPTSSKGLK